MGTDRNKKPLVSICCTSYNHEKYLRQCLEGFVIQQTNFSFEILVHEDASTDNTAIILKEYETKYPHLFRCVYQTINQFAIQNTLTNILFPMSRGKYIALCEGDDYWTDPLKLQKQVNFLETNTEYVVCGHGVKVSNGITEEKDVFCIPGDFSQEDLVLNYPISTLSMVFSKEALGPIPAWFTGIFNGDLVLNTIMLQNGKGHILNEIMGVHIVHIGGMWSMQKASVQKEKFIKSINILLKQKGILKPETRKLFIKEKKSLQRNYSTYDKINVLLLIKGEINVFAYFGYNIEKIKKYLPEVLINILKKRHRK